jgi:hypothetical protein
MAKQQRKQVQAKQPGKPMSPSGGGTFTYLVRNFIIVLVIGFLFLGIDRMDEKQGRLPQMYQEFEQLRQSGANQPRLQELYGQIMEAQSDTSVLNKLTRGYYWAVHGVAESGLENVRDIESKATRPLTRNDKFAMRVGLWPLIDYINKNTPENAVIYLPKGDSAISNNGKWNYVYSAEWMEYFIYPRLCITMGAEKANPELAKRVTHVVIVEGKGYDKLKYDVPESQRVAEGVFPIDSPPANKIQK